MKVEINYFPPEKVISVPGLESTYPFDIDGDFKYIVNFCDILEELFCIWMNNPDYYPIYSLAEIYDSQQEEYEELFQMQNMTFTYMKGSRKNTLFMKVVIRTPHQFNQYFPYLYGNGSMNNLTLWSLKQDSFRLEEREYEAPSPIKRTKKNRTILVKPKWVAITPVATMTENSTMFWVGPDGNYITAFSSDEQFSTVESLQKIVPENIELVVVDYAME
ncbi:hypothetical protein [Paenibacillus harenae]|uniref:hypothetical protein n=1 Tax=Paenibacillus harenae TaxID=306543 RepID=UPI00040B95D4|nr:hypothetical protein [Paenibacillus harenae]